MPGTIQVSVLDLMDLPSSSSSSSSISVKVSMGKKQYQTWDKGDFSFPLLTLRDNLIITLHDAEGKELSRTGVETMSVVQKGILDDFFVLEGGGRLHMKFQFTLSDEERKRIQELRETALKKKQEELLITNSLRLSETAALATVGGNVGSSSMSLNHEVTDSPESLVQMEAVSNTGGPIQSGLTSNPDNRSKDPISGSGNGDGVLLDQLEQPVPDQISASIQKDSISNPDNYSKVPISDSGDGNRLLLTRLEQPVPNDMDGSEETSSTVLSEELQIGHTEANEKILDKRETQLPPIDITTRPPILSLEALDPHPGDHSVSCTLEEDRILDKRETQLTPTDIPMGTISSLEALDTHSGEYSASGTLEKDRILSKIETLLTPTDIPMRPISLLEALDTHSGGHSVSGILETDKILDKTETQLPPTGIPMRPISLKKALDPDSGHHSVSGTLEEEDRIRNPEKQSELKKTPSNVRKMISAFESSQAKELAPRVDAPTMKIQLNKSKSTGSLKGPNVKDLMIERNNRKQIAETESSLSSTGKSQEKVLQQSLKYIREQKDTGLEQRTKKNMHEHETSQEELQEAMTVKNKTREVAETESSLSAIGTSQKMKLQQSVNYIRERKYISTEQHGKEGLREHETSQEELTGVSAAETATFMRQMPARPVDTDQSCSVSKDQQDSNLKLLEEELKTCIQDTEKLYIPESLSEKTQLVAHCGVEQYPFDSSGSCIFPDESRRLCITTASKQVMDLVGGCGIFAETDRRKMSLSRTEAMEEGKKLLGKVNSAK
ncbi:hypothetical protein BVC80_209g178 [Macleaya cordata]|uniref:Uncharacterized protein n=1 Tax=Macleaya cordata TaxID=56857 RepID=A0A200QDB3_MACCD|nr:hypothetical protein BVC80_209g178 [Macleaya cordata]